MCRFPSLPSASVASVTATSQNGYSVVGQKESGDHSGQSSPQQGQIKMFSVSGWST